MTDSGAREIVRRGAGAPSGAVLAIALAVGVAAISSAALLIRCARTAPLVIAFYRLAYASVMLAPASLLRRGARGKRASGDVALQLATGVVLAIHFGCWIASLAPRSAFATSVAASTVLVTMHPLLVALATPLVLHERVPRHAWWGIAIALAGGIAIAISDARTGVHRLVGDVLAFSGAVAAAAYFVAGRRLRARLSLLEYVMPVYVTAAVALGIACLVTHQPMRGLPLREHAIFLALAAGPMILGHATLGWSLRYVPAWAVSTVIVAEPVLSSAIVFAVLGESPPTTAVLGGGIVLAGVMITTRQTLRNHVRPASASITERTPSTREAGGAESGTRSSW